MMPDRSPALRAISTAVRTALVKRIPARSTTSSAETAIRLYSMPGLCAFADGGLPLGSATCTPGLTSECTHTSHMRAAEKPTRIAFRLCLDAAQHRRNSCS